MVWKIALGALAAAGLAATGVLVLMAVAIVEVLREDKRETAGPVW